MIVFDEYNYALELDNQKIDTTYNIIKKGIVLAKLYFSQGLDENLLFLIVAVITKLSKPR